MRVFRLVLWVAPCLLTACQARPSDGGIVSAASTTRCSDSGSVLHGVDVSSYQGNVGWRAAQSAGWSFGVTKATEGLTYRDSTFASNWSGMRDAGVVRGAYHFFHANDDGKAQADYMLDLLDANGGLRDGDLPPTLDLEVTDGQSAADILAGAKDFIAEVRARVGRPPILYTYLSFWQDTLGDPALPGVPLWIAVYNGGSCPQLPNAFADWTMWQYSDSASVPGIGSSDADLFNGSWGDLQAFVHDARIVKNGDPRFSSGGPWVASTSDPGYDGANYLVVAPGTRAWASWGLYFAGRYELFARFAPDPNRTSRALYRVRTSSSAVPVEVRVDQRHGGRVSLGTFTLTASAWVSLDASDGDGYTVANAIEAAAQ